MTLTLATWNINSIRLRIGNVERFVTEFSPDIICFQETKSPDEHFPDKALAAMGYPHQVSRGMKGYNGVAIVSRRPFQTIDQRDWCGRRDCRHAAALFDGFELHNLYIPAGGDIPDPAVNVKFAHKLQFLDELTAWFAEQATRPHQPMVLVGDLNVAPLEQDVWSHKQLLDVVSHTPIEVEKLTALQQAGGFVDAMRHFVPADQKLFSWWSYRARDWEISDRGRRLDHVWVSPSLVPRLHSLEIAKAARSWEKPSDHVPVLVRFTES